MSVLPKTRLEEVAKIWTEEVTSKAFGRYEKNGQVFVILDEELLKQLIQEIIDDVMPADIKAQIC